MNNENIINYIMCESNVPIKKGMLSSLVILLMLGVPCSVMGKYSEVTRFMLLPLAMMFIWDIYIIYIAKMKRELCLLFMGTVSFFLSMLYLMAAYKVASIIWQISVKQVFVVLGVFILYLGASYLCVIYWIRKDAYKQKYKTTNLVSIFLVASLMGLYLGKSLKNASQNTIVLIMVGLLIFMAFLISMGSLNLLKYYYLKVLNK